MRLECGVVPVHFVGENFCIVVLRQQDFELQGALFIFQAACLVCRQQSYDLISPPWGNLDRDDVGKLLHGGFPRKVRGSSLQLASTVPPTCPEEPLLLRTTPSRYSAAVALGPSPRACWQLEKAEQNVV